jgi:oligopeptide/dipeptide ABC transporter ATP-binding protein
MKSIVEMRNVTKVFGGRIGSKEANVALDDMTFEVTEGSQNIFTIAGESGSGKTTMMMLLLGFYEPSAGQIFYNGKDIWKLSKEETMDFRKNIQAIFQDPFAVYNPFYKVDNLLSIPIKNFGIAKNKKQTREIMENALIRVGLRPEETLGRFPHQLSGGQRQRIAVARALILQPKLLIADEPVSMVDASLRATILKQIRELNQELRIPVLYITHDLTTAYHVSDFIIVLYRGVAVEVGETEQVITNPKHPYTQLLVNSIPWPDTHLRWGEAVEASSGKTITDNQGCKFANRCPHVYGPCTQKVPPLYRINDKQTSACYLYQASDVLDRTELAEMFKPV